MIKTFFASRRWALWAYGCGLFLLSSLFAQVQMTVALNGWRKRLYDTFDISTHTIDEFWAVLVDFVWIVGPYVFLAVITLYATRRYALSWRTAINEDYLPRWLPVASTIEGASQRIQEDTRDFADLVESLMLQFVKSLMTLFAFWPLLWGLSEKVHIEFHWLIFLNNFPGSLVWVATATTLVGMGISWLVGIKLKKIQFRNQVVEAAYRDELVLHEKRRIVLSLDIATDLFIGLRLNYNRLYAHFAYYDMWANFYDLSMNIVPYIVAAPSLYSSLLTLGVLIQISDAFARVHGSMSFFIHNRVVIAKLGSIYMRLRQFEATLPAKV